MTTTDDYAYLWNGSQPGWVLLRINRQSLSIVVNFAPAGPTLRQVAAMRSAVPSFSAMSPSEAFAVLKGKGRVPLGRFDSKEGRRLEENCLRNGLAVESTVIDTSSYLPFNEKSNQCLMIEDDELANSVCRQALAQGTRIKHIEA